MDVELFKKKEQEAALGLVFTYLYLHSACASSQAYRHPSLDQGLLLTLLVFCSRKRWEIWEKNDGTIKVNWGGLGTLWNI